VKIVMRLWRRWEKPARASWDLVSDLNDDYPKVDDAAVSEPIDDKFFDEMWAATKQRKHLKAGHPADPFAFTCLDPTVKVYRTENFQKDLVVTV
jgi:spermidine/putrescine-binding protein